jgi:hypothetical protein
MFNPTGTMLYTPFLLSPLLGWVKVPRAIQERSQAQVLEMVKAMCSKEEKKMALRRLLQ